MPHGFYFVAAVTVAACQQPATPPVHHNAPAEVFCQDVFVLNPPSLKPLLQDKLPMPIKNAECTCNAAGNVKAAPLQAAC